MRRFCRCSAAHKLRLERLKDRDCSSAKLRTCMPYPSERDDRASLDETVCMDCNTLPSILFA